MVYAAICSRCLTYRYRTDDLPPDASPEPQDFTPIAPQASPALHGQKATCDTCSADLKFVCGGDWATLTAPAVPSRNGDPAPGPPSRRTSIAPAAITELFRVEPGEDVKDMRVIAGDRILVVTSRRIVVVDPNLIG